MQISWFLPTHPDGPYLGSDVLARKATLGYLSQVAQAADQLGYDSILLPTGRSYEDAWITAATLVPATQRLRFIVAARPGLIAPTPTARMTATLDRLSGGRVDVNVVVGGDPAEARADGQFLTRDERYEQADEFLTIWRRLLAGEETSLEGKYVTVEGARQKFAPVQKPHPPLLIGASSDAGIDLAIKHVDTFLTWGEPPAAVAEKLEKVRTKARAAGRTIKFGIRLHTIVRETDEAAWAAADDLLRYVDDDLIAARQRALKAEESEGQRRMTELAAGSRGNLEVSPNLWAGVGLVRGGAGTALVGSAETVAERLHEYRDLGIDQFILSGFPHLEECYRVAELLFPALGRTDASESESGEPVLAGGQVTELATAR